MSCGITASQWKQTVTCLHGTKRDPTGKTSWGIHSKASVHWVSNLETHHWIGASFSTDTVFCFVLFVLILLQFYAPNTSGSSPLQSPFFFLSVTNYLHWPYGIKGSCKCIWNYCLIGLSNKNKSSNQQSSGHCNNCVGRLFVAKRHLRQDWCIVNRPRQIQYIGFFISLPNAKSKSFVRGVMFYISWWAEERAFVNNVPLISPFLWAGVSRLLGSYI